MTTQTPEEVIQQHLAQILAEVEGIKHTFTTTPQSLAASLPAGIPSAENGTPTERSGPQWMEIRREWTLRVYVVHITSGITGEAEAAALPFSNRVMKKILSYPAAKAAGHWTNLEWLSDSGVARLPTFSGEEFLGVEHKVRITYRVPYTYAAGE